MNGKTEPSRERFCHIFYFFNHVKVFCSVHSCTENILGVHAVCENMDWHLFLSVLNIDITIEGDVGA